MKSLINWFKNIRNFTAPNWLWIGVFFTISIVIVFFLNQYYWALEDAVQWLALLLLYFIYTHFVLFLISLLVFTGVFFCSIRFFILLLFLPFILFTFGEINHDWSERESRCSSGLAMIMQETLRMPDLQLSTKDISDIKGGEEGDWLDLESISEEEWRNVECNYPRHYDGSAYHHNDCIRPRIRVKHTLPEMAYKYFADSKGIFNSSCIYVTIHEYILKYPKILNNILKIAEKPCYYRSDPNKCSLFCTKLKHKWWEAEKTCIIINIIDSEGYFKFQLRVIRRDNAHLSAYKRKK